MTQLKWDGESISNINLKPSVTFDTHLPALKILNWAQGFEHTYIIEKI